jgi:long-chain acyl-CoA synthetase
MLVHLVNFPDLKEFDVSSLTAVVAGSAPLAEELRSDFSRKFGCSLTDGYGQSEATCTISAYREDEEFVLGSAGRPAPGIEVCVMDDENRQLRPGETGEICTRSKSVMKGYWRDEPATQAAIVEGWLHTGDIGHLNNDGYVFITDRKKDLVIKGAENISPREIENAIHRNPAISEVAVFGVPDAKFQEEIAAAVVLKPGQDTTAEQVLDSAGKFISRFKLPRYVQFLEQLPKNSNGKVLKRLLKESFQQSDSISADQTKPTNP